MQVGFIGLGVMGLPMAGHLLRAGHEVTVASRSRGPIDAAVALGARDGGSPAGVAEAADVVVLCVPDTPDVEQVVRDLLPGLRPGAVVVDCSTVDTEAEVRVGDTVRAAGGDYLDAPVSGGDVGARNGTLTVMVGGSAAALDKARPVLDAFAARVVHVGGPGAGQVVKAANNFIFASQMAAVAEAFTMIAKSGVDLATALDVIQHSSGDCSVIRSRVPFEGLQPESPVSQGWAPGFATALMLKDLHLARVQMERLGIPAVTLQAAIQLQEAAVEAGYAADDMASIGRVVRAAAGIL